MAEKTYIRLGWPHVRTSSLMEDVMYATTNGAETGEAEMAPQSGELRARM